MTTAHGFTLVWEKTIPECKSLARFWRHETTGAELLSLKNDDENKVFGVSFRTPPQDSTGLPHILEHSVLCGSEKYPVKEPFVELLKGSLQTFLNAFTYPDKTCYPVASANTRDFRNLTDVYLDAVFFPRIPVEVFQQEGWHLEPGENGGYILKGVVYNEMKGVFSSPEAVLSRFSLHALFPDTIYGLESGGDPEVIPELTYEDFIRFHKTCYHPSNARFFFWGDDDEDERLAQVGGAISRFSRSEPAPRVALQERRQAPQTVTVPFVAGEEEEKGMVCCNWLLAETREATLTMAFRMLDHILLGMPASPLRRALIESGLGEDITGGGLEDELLQCSYSIGLRGVQPENAGRVEALILETLQTLANEGIDPKYLDAAVNSVEFELREKNSGRFPVGLAVMLQSLTTWLHDGDPVAPLRYEEPLAAIKGKLAAREPYFENLIRQYFLTNTHRATVILTPDPALGETRANEEAARVANIVDSLPQAERNQIAARAERLQALQETPDDPAALARIPRLEVADLPRAEKPIPSETARLGTDLPVMFHALPTSGISYADAFFDLAHVPGSLFPLLPLLGRALTEMGTARRDFVDLNMAIASKTGGLDAGPSFYTARASRSPLPRLAVSGKVAPDKIADLFSLMEEIILSPDFDRQERFLRMVLEEKARLEHALVPAGHTFVSQRLRSALSATGMMEEATGGVSYLFFLRELADRVAKNWESVRADLTALHGAVFTRQGLDWNITGEEEHKQTLFDGAAKLADALPRPAGPSGSHGITGRTAPAREALLLPAQVNYVGSGGNLYDAGYAYHGSVHVILKQLRTGWLWEKVRVQGGAYGAFCAFDRMAGAFVLASYRDPNVRGTLDIFGRTAKHLASTAISRRELDSAIIGAMGEVDAYMLPDAKGSAAHARALIGDTAESRQKMRDEILSTTQDHFHAFAVHLGKALENGPVCVLGGDVLEKTAKAEGGWDCVKVL
ncbi:Presequence protease 1, chloroplastic/mitochondrial [uncultured delta proteobacterium]|uniref:Presequence protease 1, chloroplastic/mitochondrial n=1 Tax=uncultured delta proteobacterium TaxID=34034 RepID=A0A212KHD1_9DELT|nr:Presequence protease 1, chloroplastic/mitochondrial [uncultured delta proteobacterium]